MLYAELNNDVQTFLAGKNAKPPWDPTQQKYLLQDISPRPSLEYLMIFPATGGLTSSFRAQCIQCAGYYTANLSVDVGSEAFSQGIILNYSESTPYSTNYLDVPGGYPVPD